MADLYDVELPKARIMLADQGLDPDLFTFGRVFLPPDSEDGAMFTVRYEVRVGRAGTAETLTLVGGIGLDWVGELKWALDEGRLT